MRKRRYFSDSWARLFPFPPFCLNTKRAVSFQSLSRRLRRRNPGQGFPIWVVATQQHAYPCVASNNGSSVKPFQVYTISLTTGLSRPTQIHSTDTLPKSTSDTGKQNAKLLGPPVMTAGAVGEYNKRSFLDTSSPVSTSTVQIAIQILLLSGQVGRHPSWIATSIGRLGGSDTSPSRIPGRRGIYD